MTDDVVKRGPTVALPASVFDGCPGCGGETLGQPTLTLVGFTAWHSSCWAYKFGPRCPHGYPMMEGERFDCDHPECPNPPWYTDDAAIRPAPPGDAWLPSGSFQGPDVVQVQVDTGTAGSAGEADRG